MLTKHENMLQRTRAAPVAILRRLEMLPSQNFEGLACQVGWKWNGMGGNTCLHGNVALQNYPAC